MKIRVPHLPKDVQDFLLSHFIVNASELRFSSTEQGNMNNVIFCSHAGNSVVIKFPRKSVNLGGGNGSIPRARTLLEAFALRSFEEFGIGHFPRILFCSKIDFCIVMEEVHNRTQWDQIKEDDQLNLIKKDVVPFLTRTHDPSPMYMPKRLAIVSKKMQRLIERVTFQLPASNLIPPYVGLLSDRDIFELSKTVSRINASSMWKENVKNVLSVYKDRKECLIHGDLHLDSMVISNTENGLRAYIIDTEFSCMSVREFDAGVLSAHIMMASCTNQSAKIPISLADLEVRAAQIIAAVTSFRAKIETGNLTGRSFVELDVDLVKCFMLTEIFAKLAGPVPSRHLQLAVGAGRAYIMPLLGIYVESETYKQGFVYR